MNERNITVNRFSIVSSRSFDDVVDRLTREIGRPDMHEFRESLAAVQTPDQLDALVRRSIGPSGLMEFIRFDAGEVIRKSGGADAPKLLRLLVGNPLIMRDMARTVADAASYAPVTILVDERPDGVRISYDSMASLLAGYGSRAATAVAEALDAKVSSLIRDAAA